MLERVRAAVETHAAVSTVRVSTADLGSLIEEHADLVAAVKCVSETSDGLLSRAEAAEAQLASVSGVTRVQLVKEARRKMKAAIAKRLEALLESFGAPAECKDDPYWMGIDKALEFVNGAPVDPSAADDE